MNRRSAHEWLLLFLASGVFLVNPSCITARQPVAPLMYKELSFDGHKRSYYVHLPEAYRSKKSLPVVFALHGGGKADGDELAERTGYNDLADREGFIAVYPNGIDSQWNDGRGKTFYKAKDNAKVDDVGFISKVIDHIIHHYKGDPRRIYVMGLSNGGMMTLRLGCELSPRLAAIAPVIANMPKNIAGTCNPDSFLPVLLMNGTKDPFIPWDGGPVTIFGQTFGDVMSTEQTVQFWVGRNKCDLDPKTVSLPDVDPSDGSRVRVTTYGSSTGTCDVRLYAVEGGGHNFPGSKTPDRPRILGTKNKDIAGPEIIWRFFMQHER
jgi:polyhydroxybutyrate depolymerase